VDVTQTEEDFA